MFMGISAIIIGIFYLFVMLCVVVIMFRVKRLCQEIGTLNDSARIIINTLKKIKDRE